MTSVFQVFLVFSQLYPAHSQNLSRTSISLSHCLRLHSVQRCLMRIFPRLTQFLYLGYFLNPPLLIFQTATYDIYPHMTSLVRLRGTQQAQYLGYRDKKRPQKYNDQVLTLYNVILRILIGCRTYFETFFGKPRKSLSSPIYLNTNFCGRPKIVVIFQYNFYRKK